MSAAKRPPSAPSALKPSSITQSPRKVLQIREKVLASRSIRFNQSDAIKVLSGSSLVSNEVWKVPGKKVLAIISSTFTDTLHERNAILGEVLWDLRREIKSQGSDVELQFVDMRYGVRDENTLEHDTWLACAREIERCRKESEGTFFVSLQSQKYGYQMAPKRIARDIFDAVYAKMDASIKLCELPHLKGDADTFRQLLEDVTNGNKTNILESLYEVIKADVCLKRPHFFFSLNTNHFGEDISMMDSKDLLKAKFENADLQHLKAIFPDEKMIEVIRKHVKFYETVTVRDFVGYWYRIDFNSLPTCYELRHLTDFNDPLYWRIALPVLVDAFKDVSFEPDRDASLLVARSVTEYETRIALQTEESARRCFWFHRPFAGGVTQTHSKYWEFDDTLQNEETKSKLAAMKSYMRGKLTPLGTVKEYTTLTLQSALDHDTSHKEYLETFKTDFKNMMRRDILSIGQNYKSWISDGCALGLQGKDIDEMFHHMKWAQQKISTFEGREDLVRKCLNAHVKDVHHQKKKKKNKKKKGSEELSLTKMNFRGISLCIVGVSGSGKTALASFVSQQLKAQHADMPLIIRFCGTSAASNDAFSLMRSICLQINFLCNEGDWGQQQLDLIKEYDALVAYFHSLLKEHPVFLVIDSLDQLTNNYKEQSEISFLKGVDPHPQGRIIVTTLPFDEKYKYLCSKRLAASQVPFIAVEPLVDEADSTSVTVIRALTEKVFAKQNRSLIPQQWSVFEKSALIEPTALYMNLSVYVMSAWKSFDDLKENVLTPTVFGVINQIFDDLENKFGKILVQAVVAFLSFAVEGVADMEMVDLLSISDDILESVFQYSRPDIYRLPYHVWLRIRSALGPLVVEREGGAFTWYHRQLKEVGRMRSLRDAGKAKEYHSILGKYFSNLVEVDVVRLRNITSQERFLSAYPCYSPNTVINKRRCIEACHHLIDAGMYSEAAAEMFNVDAIYAHFRVSYAHCFDFLKDALALYSSLITPGNEPEERSLMEGLFSQRIDHYKRFLVLETSFIANDPSVVNINVVLDRQPTESHVYQDFRSFFEWNTGISSKALGIFAEEKVAERVCNDSCMIHRSLGGQGAKFSSLVASLKGHTKDVKCIAVSPDDQHIISGSDDKTIKIWDRLTGECVSTLEGHTAWVNSIAVSFDGLHIISGSNDHSIKIWDRMTGECVSTLEGHTDDVMSVVVSPNGQHVISGSGDKTIKIWHRMTGECVSTLEGHSSSVMSVVLSPDGRHVVSGSLDKTVKIWDRLTCACVSTFEGHTNYVTSIAVSPDGQHVISGSHDKTIKIWDRLTGECVSTFEGHIALVNSVAVSFDGLHVISGSADHSIKMWDLISKEYVSNLKGHSGFITSVAVSRDGQHVLSGSQDETVKIWDRMTAKSFSDFEGHTGWVNSVSLSSDGQFVISGSFNPIVKVFNRMTGECVSTLEGHSKEVKSVAVSSDGLHVVSGSTDKTIKIWDRITGECVSTLEGHTALVNSVAVSFDGLHVISGSADHSIKMWDLISKECVSTLEGHTDDVMSVVVSPNGQHVISGSGDKTIKIWDRMTGECVSTLEGHSSSVMSVAVSFDGHYIISGSTDYSIQIWDRMTKDCVSTLVGHSSSVMSVVLSPDGRHIVSGSLDKTVKIWDRMTGECITSLKGHTGGVTSVAVSPDGFHVLSGSFEGNAVKIWERMTGECVSLY